MDQIKKRTCPHCKKGFVSLYEKQLEQNYQSHLLNCKEKKR